MLTVPSCGVGTMIANSDRKQSVNVWGRNIVQILPYDVNIVRGKYWKAPHFPQQNKTYGNGQSAASDIVSEGRAV